MTNLEKRLLVSLAIVFLPAVALFEHIGTYSLPLVANFGVFAFIGGVYAGIGIALRVTRRAPGGIVQANIGRGEFGLCCGASGDGYPAFVVARLGDGTVGTTLRDLDRTLTPEETVAVLAFTSQEGFAVLESVVADVKVEVAKRYSKEQA